MGQAHQLSFEARNQGLRPSVSHSVEFMPDSFQKLDQMADIGNAAFYHHPDRLPTEAARILNLHYSPLEQWALELGWRCAQFSVEEKKKVLKR